MSTDLYNTCNLKCVIAFNNQQYKHDMKTSKELLNDIQKLKGKSSLFTLPLMVITLWKLKRLNQKRTKHLNLYASLNELPLDCFIDCIIDKNYQRMIKTGTATENELLTAWENLFIEYCESTDTVDYKTKFKLQKELGINETKLLIINSCLSVLVNINSEYCIKILKDLGYKYNFDYTQQSKFLDDLMLVTTNKKSIELNIMSLKIKLDDIEKKEKLQPPITREYFTSWLTMLAKWKRVVVIRANEITVSEFLSNKSMFETENNKQSVRNGK